MHHSEPPCGKCFPGLDPENIDAWRVYQIACINEMGISVADIKIICDAMKARDFQEVILKIERLVSVLRKEKTNA